MTDTPAADTPVDASLVDELLSRDPLKLTEKDVDENTTILITLLRERIKAWNEEDRNNKATGTRPSGSRTKKKQLTAERQVAQALLDFDL